MTTDETPYGVTFFEEHNKPSRRSASIVLPYVFDLVPAKSVVDVGCGTGTWLAECARLGVERILGIDGPYVKPSMLLIPQESFMAQDLTDGLHLREKFDIAISLEVAEHLPADCAVRFVHGLVSLAPAVFFSAAIPYQVGTDHRNMQWQDYWAELFEAEGYVPLDCVRQRVWNNPDVEVWYAQNALLYVHKDLVAAKRQLQDAYQNTRRSQLSVVHPSWYHTLVRPRPSALGASDLIRMLPKAILQALRKRISMEKRQSNEYGTVPAGIPASE